jgi:hypothetical protein
MPWIRGKFYMNPFYGRAVERARSADEGRPWSEHEPHSESLLVHRGEANRVGTLNTKLDSSESLYEHAKALSMRVAGQSKHARQHSSHQANRRRVSHRGETTTRRKQLRESQDRYTTRQLDSERPIRQIMVPAVISISKRPGRPGTMAHAIRNRSKSGTRGGLASPSLT